MKGRRPDPAEVKAAKGNPGKRRIGRAPAAGGEAEKPHFLDGGARRIWDRLAPDLARMQLLQRTDAIAFGRYCKLLDRWTEASKALDAEGATYESESQHGTLKRLNPKFLVVERLEKRLLDLEDRFGLNPAARQSIFAKLAAQATTATLFDRPAGDKPKEDQPPADVAPIGFLGGGARLQ